MANIRFLFVLVVLSFLSQLGLKAEDIPFNQNAKMLVEGKEWVYNYYHYEAKDTTLFVDGQEVVISIPDHDVSVWPVTYTLVGDTVIGGQSYYKLYRKSATENPVYDRALREVGSTVYEIRKDNTHESVLIEFNPEQFDQETLLIISGGFDPLEETTDSIVVSNRIFRRHKYISKETSSACAVAVEGIGYEACGLVLGMGFYLPACACDYMIFDSCYEDGTCIFRNTDFHLASYSSQRQDTIPATYWVYGTTSNWYSSQDTVYCKRLNEWIFSMTDETVDIDGKKYYLMENSPANYPTSSRNTATGSEDALGIRLERGRVYVNYNQYLEYLKRSHDGETHTPSFGNPDYIPYHLTEDGELVLYDYNMEVGDRYRSVESYDDIEVTEKDSVSLCDGRKHCRLTLSNGLILIEGVGCINSNGRLIDYLNPAEQLGSHFTCLLYAFSDNAEKLYENSAIKINELETSGISSEKNSSADDAITYDLQGRRVSSPKKGVYIRDGRKVVVK